MMLKGSKIFFLLLFIGIYDQYARCESIEKNSIKSHKKVLSSIVQKKIPENKLPPIKKHATTHLPLPPNICNSKVCPEGLIYYRSRYKDYCYTLLNPQKFPPQCPYPLFLSVADSQVEDIYNFYRNITIWLMAKRKTTNEFGPFEWISKDFNHGLPVSYYIKTSNNIAEKNCLVTFNYSYKPARCEEKHHALCIYPYDYPSISKYCRQHYKNSSYLTCTADSINIGNHSCYCEQANRALRNSFCDNLAEPLSPHQNDILINKLDTVHDVCWIGLFLNESGLPQWTNSNKSIDYKCWASDVNISKPFGAVKFTRNGGWMLAYDEGTIQCGICELSNLYDKNVSLQLKYNPQSNSIELRVKNPFEITDYFGGHYILFCFAGPTLNKFKHKVSEPFYDFNDNPQSTPEVWVGNFVNSWNFPVYYWCEAYQQPNLKPVYSNKILVCGGFGRYEYTMRVRIWTPKNKDPYLNQTHLLIRNHFLQKINLEYWHELRVMKILSYDQKYSQMDMVLHLTTEGNQDEEAEYKYLEMLFNDVFTNDMLVREITYFGRSDFCLPESTESNNKILYWPKTVIGGITLPLEICLQLDGNPVMRKCEGDFLNGGVWSEVIGTCTDKELSEKSKQLHELLNNDILSPTELSKNLSIITSNKQEVMVVDIYLVSKLLEKLDTFEDDVNISDVINIISNVMCFDPNELRKAQELLNCTDHMLYSLDKILTKLKLDNDKKFNIFFSKNILVHVADVRTTNIIGVAIKGNAYDDFESCKIIPLYNNISVQKILLDDTFELAAFLPQQLIREIENCIPSELPIKVFMILFYNDGLFNENVEETRQSNSRILNILIPDLFCSFSTPISIIFKPLHSNNFEKKCAYWKYGMDGLIGNNIQGYWSEDGIPTMENNMNKTYAVCGFDHVTHFALLMMGKFTKDVISETQILVLDIITAIGTTLSLGSIAAMFVIAIASKNWRERSSNKILLNFSVAIGLQMIFLYVADNLNQDGIWCVVLGAALHYTVLSEFLWMLMIAFLQYRKFVTVFSQQIPNLVGKTCVICWCLPLIPIMIILSISSDSYKKNIQGLCYPSDEYFYFAVVLPISIIVLINLVIFSKIIFAICQSKIESYGPKENDVKLQVLLALFLFFLLGISWVFGIVLSFGGGIVFSYLFCLTATFQGLVMFLFFVVMNENTKNLWMRIRVVLNLKSQHRRNSSSSYSQTQITEGMDRKSF